MVSTEWSALTQRAADTQASFARDGASGKKRANPTSAAEARDASSGEADREPRLHFATAPKQQIQEPASLTFIERAENVA